MPSREYHDWPALKARYVMGEESQADLAAATGVSQRQITEHSSSEGWPEEREAFRRAVAAKALQIAREKQARSLATVKDRVQTIGRAALTAYGRQFGEGAQAPKITTTEFVALAQLLLRMDHALPSLTDYRPDEGELESVDTWLESLTGGPILTGGA